MKKLTANDPESWELLLWHLEQSKIRTPQSIEDIQLEAFEEFERRMTQKVAVDKVRRK